MTFTLYVVLTVKYPVVISGAFQHFGQICDCNWLIKKQPTRTGYPITSLACTDNVNYKLLPSASA